MKRRISQITIAAILTLCAQMAFASEWVEMSEFTVWASNFEEDVIRVEVPGDKVNPSACSNPDSYMVLETLSDGNKWGQTTFFMGEREMMNKWGQATFIL